MRNSKLCPRYHTPWGEVRPWLDLYGHYTGGHLYRAGGLQEQPALYLEVMHYIDGAVKEARSDGQSKISN